VRYFVTGAGEWRESAEWPPPNLTSQRWYLHAEARLDRELPRQSEPDAYRYEPRFPTPALAGPRLTAPSLPTDNAELEARPDVLTYTSSRLREDLEVIGPVTAELHVRSSLEHADFFARLCDVDPSGRSVNVCDALRRVSPGRPDSQPDGSIRLVVELWPTAHRFRRGHRLRLQVSSGAHPRYARNQGTGEPLATATALIAADQSVLHDPDHPSAIVVSVAG
jgi:putative CocE/NonD family hydrolase